MELWAWVEDKEEALRKQGEQRLANLVADFPGVALSLRYQEFDALVPEALALARAHGDPWLEVYFRHWDLQSRVFGRMHGERALRDAVSLVDFSHGKETSSCPQSVCTVQDLAACYGVVDGPGWAPERLEVTKDTLARIDPTWACFTCISDEHASALRDAGRTDDALAFIDAQARKHLTPGTDAFDRFCDRSRISLLSDLGRHEEALALADRLLAAKQEDESKTLMRRTQRALLLARLGRFEESAEALPSWARWHAACEMYPMWSDCAVLLVRGGALPNDSTLSAIFRTMTERLDENGAVRTLFEVAGRQLELALARRSAWAARRALQAMERAVPRLRAPLDAPARLEALRRTLAELDATPPALPFETPDAFLASLAQEDPEADLPLLEVASARWPDDEQVALLHAAALKGAGCRADAVALLDARLRAGQAGEETLNHLGSLLLSASPQEFDAWEATVRAHVTEPALRVLPTYWRGARALELKRWKDAVAAFEQVLEVRPEVPTPRRFLARALLRSGGGVTAAERARAQFSELETRGELELRDHWDRMTAATIIGDWAQVRALAAELELDVDPGEGPIDEAWARCQLSVEGEDGALVELSAIRTGPVTARISSLTFFEDGRSRFGEVWVFDAQPLNEGPSDDADEETQRSHRWIYPAVFQLAASTRRTRFLSGPEPEELDLLRETLEAHDLVWSEYEADDGQLDWLLAVPESLDEEALAKLVTPLRVTPPDEL